MEPAGLEADTVRHKDPNRTKFKICTMGLSILIDKIVEGKKSRS